MNKIRLSMILFIASESVFFVLLIIAYVVYHRISASGYEASHYLEVSRTLIFTLCLLSSSLTVWKAGIEQGRGRKRATAGWLIATILLGAVFLAGQGTEYAQLVAQNITISRDLFGTTFFTLTGFHGLHVLTGIIMLTILLGTGLRRQPTAPSGPAMEAVSMYWHFVDAVWIIIFPTVYLWGHL